MPLTIILPDPLADQLRWWAKLAKISIEQLASRLLESEMQKRPDLEQRDDRATLSRRVD
jgi:hypothetical protein